MIHSGKGINGLRIDGVSNVHMENIEIYDIVDETPQGRSECGEYTTYDGSRDCHGACGGHFRQTQPMQIGFSGNMVQGININAAQNVKLKDINVHDMISHNGPVFGISVWPAVDVIFEGDISTTYLKAGSKVEKGSLTYLSRPNLAPEVCGVRIYNQYTVNDFTYEASIDATGVDIAYSACFDGHVHCLGQSKTKYATNLGDYTNERNNDELTCDWSHIEEIEDSYSDISSDTNIDGANVHVLNSNEAQSEYVKVPSKKDEKMLDDVNIEHKKNDGAGTYTRFWYYSVVVLLLSVASTKIYLHGRSIWHEKYFTTQLPDTENLHFIHTYGSV